MATDSVIEIARSLNYYFILFHSCLRADSYQCSTRTHEVGAGGAFVSKVVTSYSPSRLFLSGYLPGSLVNQVINNECYDSFMGHEQHHPQ